MIKTIEICDWCEKRDAVVVISLGNDKGDYLCKVCVEAFLEILADEHLNELEGSGDWRLAEKEVKLVSKEKKCKKCGKHSIVSLDGLCEFCSEEKQQEL